MTSYRIKLVVEGLDRDDGHVRLEVFVRELQKLQSALGRADARVSDGNRCSYFAVVGLSHNSPATVELEARVAPNSGRDCRASALKLFSDAIDAVERGEFHAESDYDLINDIKELSAPVGETLKTVQLTLEDRAHVLTDRLAVTISAFQADQEECTTTVEGILEKVNVHDDANTFTIYPDVGPVRITCKLPQELAEKGISAIRRRVAVTGVAKFRKFAPFPHEIVADDIHIYDVETDLPEFSSLFGIAPHATGDLSSEDFVRQLRNDWV
jgi:hypothetical protein